MANKKLAKRKAFKNLNEKDQKTIQQIEALARMNLSLELLSVPILIAVIYPSNYFLIYLTFGLFVSFVLFDIAFKFIKAAKQTSLGVKGHIKIEFVFLTLELPSIIQFITILGLLSFYLQDARARGLVALFVSILLSIYLRAKRQIYMSKINTEDKDDIAKVANVEVNALAGIVVALLVFVAAELLAKKAT